MLSVTRKPGEGFLIGPDIKVFIVEIRGQQARLQITAPKEVKIIWCALKDLLPESQNAH